MMQLIISLLKTVYVLGLFSDEDCSATKNKDWKFSSLPKHTLPTVKASL